MYIKLAYSGEHSYIQLAESYRNKAGKPRQRIVATLGRADESGGSANVMLAGLLRAKGLPVTVGAAHEVEFESALSSLTPNAVSC